MKVGKVWPELRTFCGCWSLNTGIYTIGTIHTLINIGLIWYTIEAARIAIYYKYMYYDYMNDGAGITGEDLNRVVLGIFNMIRMNNIAWCIFHIIVMLTMTLLFYGIYKDLPIILKIYLFINIPGHIFLTFFYTIKLIYIGQILKIHITAFILLGAYQLLAVRSAYRILTERATTTRNSINNTAATTNTNENDAVDTPGEIPPPLPQYKHCHTCNCVGYQTPSENSPNSTTEFTRPDGCHPAEINQTNEELKDQPMVFDVTQLVRRHPLLEDQDAAQGSSIERRDITIEEKRNIENQTILFDESQLERSHPLLESSPGEGSSAGYRQPQRPTTLALTAAKTMKTFKFPSENKKTGDEAVIYDPNQLNQCRNTIIEDNNKKEA